MKPGRIISIIIGSLVAVTGFTMLLGALTLGWALAVERDDTGYFRSPTERFQTATPALTTERIDLSNIGPDDWWARRDIARVRISADSSKESSLFLGIGREADVENYLRGVRHDEIADLRWDPSFQPAYRRENAAAAERSAPPADQTFWVASTVGDGRQQLNWKVAPGDWAIVMMNADGSPGVVADVQAAVRVDALVPIAFGIGSVGMVLLALGAALIIAGAVGAISRDTSISTVDQTDGEDGVIDLAAYEGANQHERASQTPVRVSARLDPRLNRWLWLVKWFLAIPHFIVLSVLWVAYSVVTVVAFFAILLTGQYPRSLFDFNVGVLRWSWRVGYYCTSVMGTDRYPPFSLHVSDYPAELDIAYPARLSRGLIFVKWFLAIPHLVIVAVLTARWGTRNDGWGFVFSGGAISVLVVIAGFILLFSGRYPKGLFDFLMACNRWVFRVVAYVSLMTDQYPPFHLDQGPDEPSHPPRAPRTPRSPSSPSGQDSPVDQGQPGAEREHATAGRSS
jgi:hypothetical protein